MSTTLERPRVRRPSNTAGRKLRQLRINRGLSPEDLGVIVGLSGKTIRNIEAGHVTPTARSMFLLASQFDLEVTDLWHL